MIFVTVGTDGPFDRLVRVVDAWAAEQTRRDVFAQIGVSTLEPKHIQFVQFLDPPEFNRRFRQASIIVSHAGMGTILTALQHGKPVLVMPRRASLGEQRNEHQLATAEHMRTTGRVTVAFDEKDLHRELSAIDALKVSSPIGPDAQPQLIQALQEFIWVQHQPSSTHSRRTISDDL